MSLISSRSLYSYSRSQAILDGKKSDSVAILVHDKVVAGPISAPSLSLAKGLASERARAVLEDSKSDLSLANICDCAKKMNLQQSSTVTAIDVGAGVKVNADVSLTDETEEGFARLAKKARKEYQELADGSSSNRPADDFADEQAVEKMLFSHGED